MVDTEKTLKLLIESGVISPDKVAQVQKILDEAGDATSPLLDAPGKPGQPQVENTNHPEQLGEVHTALLSTGQATGHEYGPEASEVGVGITLVPGVGGLRENKVIRADQTIADGAIEADKSKFKATKLLEEKLAALAGKIKSIADKVEIFEKFGSIQPASKMPEVREGTHAEEDGLMGLADDCSHRDLTRSQIVAYLKLQTSRVDRLAETLENNMNHIQLLQSRINALETTR